MAIIAGKLAAITAVEACQKKDTSAKSLSVYRKRLNDRFVLQDLYHYRRLANFLVTHPDFMNVYPNCVNDALGMFFSGFGKPKKQLYRDILRSFNARKPFYHAFADMIAFGRTVTGW